MKGIIKTWEEKCRHNCWMRTSYGEPACDLVFTEYINFKTKEILVSHCSKQSIICSGLRESHK